MPSIVNKSCHASAFERDFWRYWNYMKPGAKDSFPEVQSVQTDLSSKDLDDSPDTSSRVHLNSPTSPDPDKLSIKRIFKFLNMSDMNVAKKNNNSLERVRLLHKSVRKGGHTMTTVEMALKDAWRCRHPVKHGPGMPTAPKSRDDLGPIVNSPLKDTFQTRMPVEKAVKRHPFTYASKQRTRRIREANATKKTSPHGTSNVPQSRTLTVFSRQIPEMTEDSLDAALSHRTAKFHDTGRGTGYWVEGRKYRTRSQIGVDINDKSDSRVVRLPKVQLDPDDPDDIIKGVALVNFYKVTEKMKTLGIDINEEEFQNGEPGIFVKSAEFLPAHSANTRICPKKQVNVRLPNTLDI
jgi:hypothetical protein